jgi:hypothetical protein
MAGAKAARPCAAYSMDQFYLCAIAFCTGMLCRAIPCLKLIIVTTAQNTGIDRRQISTTDFEAHPL